MGHLTFIAAELTCLHCGTTSPADTSTGMSNHLSPKFGGEVLKIGDRRGFDDDDFGDTFHVLRPHRPDEPVHVLHHWLCPTCGKYNWADVVFVDGGIERIAVVPFDRESIDRAHYLSDGIHEYYETVTGSQLYPNYDGRFGRLIEELLDRDRPPPE